MGAYKYYDPATGKWEITKSKSIIKSDGSLEYSPDDIKAIDNKVDGLEGDFNVHKADIASHVRYGVATGTPNNYSVDLSPAPESYTEGMALSVKINIDATGSSTLNVNGLGAKGIKKSNGNNVTNLKANGIYTMRYDGVNFILQGEGGEYGTAGAEQVRAGYTVGTENGLVTGTIPSKTAQTFTPGRTAQTIASGQYLSGVQTIQGDSNLLGSNIKSGISIFGVSGTFNGKRTATGSGVLVATTSGYSEISVSGIGFRPSTIIIEVKISNNMNRKTYIAGLDTNLNNTVYTTGQTRDEGRWWITSSGFSTVVTKSTVFAGAPVSWVAYE